VRRPGGREGGRAKEDLIESEEEGEAIRGISGNLVSFFACIIRTREGELASSLGTPMGNLGSYAIADR